MELLTSLGIDWQTIILMIITGIIGRGSAQKKLKFLARVAEDSAKYLNSLADPNPQIQQDAIAKGLKGASDGITKFIGDK